MDKDKCCSIKLNQFTHIDGWYWEITVPGEIHPRERIKEFVLDNPGLECPVKRPPLVSIVSLHNNSYIYKGVINDKRVADAVLSSVVLSRL